RKPRIARPVGVSACVVGTSLTIPLSEVHLPEVFRIRDTYHWAREPNSAGDRGGHRRCACCETVYGRAARAFTKPMPFGEPQPVDRSYPGVVACPVTASSATGAPGVMSQTWLDCRCAEGTEPSP